MALLGNTSNYFDLHLLRLADYCCRCGQMFSQDESIALIEVTSLQTDEGSIARVAHREKCVSSEDKVLMLGLWHYDVLASSSKPKGRR